MDTIRRRPAVAAVGLVWLRRLLGQLMEWQERARQRRSLQQLDGHMLKDIGLTQGDVWSESRKPFWRP